MARRAAGIPAIAGAGQLQAPLEKMRELIEVGTGQNRGSNLDQWITYRDILDMGLAKLVGNNPIYISPGDNIVPGIAAPNPIVPPAPSNFIVTGGFSHIFCEWDTPGLQYQGHGYTTIYRSTADDIGTAEAIAQTTSMVFADLSVQRGVTYYYWARFTSETDIEGPPNAPNGTPGELAPDPGLVLDSLTNQITETQLYQDLQARIDLIDVTNGGLVANLSGETTARQNAINSLQQQIDGLVVATNVEIFYQAAMPVNADASGGTLVEGSRWFDTDDQNHPYVYVNGAWQDARDQLVITVQANLATESQARTTADSAQVVRLNALEATVNNPTTGVSANSTAIGALQSTVTTHGQDITAAASDIAALESTVFDVNTGVGANASAIAGLITEVATNGDDITTLSGQVTQLINTVEHPSTGVAANAAALSTLTTQVSQIDGELSSTASAVTTLQTTVGSNTTAIEVAQNAIDGVEAQYTVKIDANGYVAGYGLAVTQNEYTGAQHSEMIFSVDRFSVGSPGKSELAFIVDGSRVVMDGALIKNATIGTAQVGTIAVDKISGITSSFILSKIGTAQITNAYIGSYIQSDTYASSGGSSGWYIGKNGTAIFNDIYARGNIEADRLKANAAEIVDTIHLAGEAVTVGNNVDISGHSLNSGTTWTLVSQVTLNVEGGFVYATAGGELYHPVGTGGSQTADFRLLINGVVVAQQDDLTFAALEPANFQLASSKDTQYAVTVRLERRVDTNYTFTRAFQIKSGYLFVLGGKR